MTTEQPRCDKCRWSHPGGGYGKVECRRYPPSVKKNAVDYDGDTWVSVIAVGYHWCGEFEAKGRIE